MCTTNLHMSVSFIKRARLQHNLDPAGPLFRKTPGSPVLEGVGLDGGEAQRGVRDNVS